MPAGSGHGFVQLVSCGLRAAFFMIYCPRRARRSRISRSAERDQGAALDLRFFEKNRVKLYLCNLLMGVAFIDTLSPSPKGDGDFFRSPLLLPPESATVEMKKGARGSPSERMVYHEK